MRKGWSRLKVLTCARELDEHMIGSQKKNVSVSRLVYFLMNPRDESERAIQLTL
jgi:hypothetical protein